MKQKVNINSYLKIQFTFVTQIGLGVHLHAFNDEILINQDGRNNLIKIIAIFKNQTLK